MDHQQQGKIKHTNRMKSKRIMGISQDRSPKQEGKGGRRKKKRWKDTVKNNDKSIELKQK